MDKERILEEITIRLKQQRQINKEIEELQKQYEQQQSDSGTVEGRNKSH